MKTVKASELSSVSGGAWGGGSAGGVPLLSADSGQGTGSVGGYCTADGVYTFYDNNTVQYESYSGTQAIGGWDPATGAVFSISTVESGGWLYGCATDGSSTVCQSRPLDVFPKR
jgi:hypothetical protein